MWLISIKIQLQSRYISTEMYCFFSHCRIPFFKRGTMDSWLTIVIFTNRLIVLSCRWGRSYIITNLLPVFNFVKSWVTVIFFTNKKKNTIIWTEWIEKNMPTICHTILDRKCIICIYKNIVLWNGCAISFDRWA